MRLISLHMGQRMLASLSLVLTLSQASIASGETGTLEEDPAPPGYLKITASVVLEPIQGVPPTIAERLTRMLDTASQPAGLALLNYRGAEGEFRLRGNLKAYLQKNEVRVVYNWVVLNATGACAAVRSGTELTVATDTFAWNAVTGPVLQAIAGEGIELVTQVAGAGRGHIMEAGTSCIQARAEPVHAIEPQTIALKLALSPEGTKKDTSSIALEALRLVNDYRKSRGMPQLTLDRRLSAAASVLATDMARHDRLSHSGPDHANLEQRLNAAGYRYVLAAENLGAGQNTVSELIDQWRDRPLESQNLLLPDAKQIGIAVQFRPGTTLKSFWTVVIGASS